MKKRQAKQENSEIILGTLDMMEIDPNLQCRNAFTFLPEEESVIPVGIHRLYDDVVTPKYETQSSACFDVRAYLGNNIVCVDAYNRMLMHLVRSVGPLPERDYQRGVNIEPGECIFIPTGLIFDIPEGFKLSFYPRSGVSGKKHLKLANCIGIVDEDYVNPSMILIYNNSEMRQSIAHGDRLAQAELVPVYRASFIELKNAPPQKTDRSGGMGHTGTA